jgi:hypothetical protein
MEASPVEIWNILKNLHFPSTKQNLVQQAMKHGASREVIRTFKLLPDKGYIHAADFSKIFEDKKDIIERFEFRHLRFNTIDFSFKLRKYYNY